MLTRYIILLRRAPRSMQQRHALFWALSVTVVAGMLWGLSLPKLFKPLPAGGVLVEVEEQARPLGSLWGQAREQFASVMASIKSTTVSTSSEETVVSVAATTTDITLSPEDIEKANARSNIVYRPVSTTTATTSGIGVTPRVVQIATTSSSVSTSTRP